MKIVDDPWGGLEPQDLLQVLPNVECVWWVAGGWAVDMWLPGPSPAHADMDIGCYREGVPLLRRALPEWEFFAAADGALTQLADDDGLVLPAAAHTLWCRMRGTRQWGLEVMVEECEGGEWLFRRDAGIRRTKETILWHAEEGVAVLRPEIQLLYKAKNLRARDQADFDATAPLLQSEDAAWLAEALESVHPGHPWLRALDAGGYYSSRCE